ncbi:hypothetical protein [Leptospira fletcheri]|uniref:hypothetical protein n=1 Tax=Leptospira fletcheri TaxID=2484981 RepID=UPI001FEBC716|nr:hypothetical protein [Leptospira fletcheri]
MNPFGYVNNLRVRPVFFLLFLVAFACTDCTRFVRKRTVSEELSPNVERAKIYLSGHTGEFTKDSEEILAILRRLIDGTVRKDLTFLPDLVSEEDGIYIDLKGHWDRARLKTELSAKDNYFRTYFFDREALEKEKNHTDVRTVRDLLLSSGGIEVDFYFETPQACEVKFKFQENRKWESELINPYFTKRKGKWYVHRLF